MFKHGVGEVQDLLKENNNPAAEFNVSYLTAFNVMVKEPNEMSLPKLYESTADILLSGQHRELAVRCDAHENK